MSLSPRVWLITGASGGLGEALALKALSAGDKVIATSRSIARLESVKSKGAAVLAFDQNKPLAHIKATVEEAIKIYGNVDFVVANAGYVHGGVLEETTPEDAVAQFQANVFGPLNLFRSILPHMRAKRSGTLVTIGSIAAWEPFPGANLYTASKAAVRMISLGLDSEVSGLGIKTCLVEPGYFRTELLASDSDMKMPEPAARIEDYAELNKALEVGLGVTHHNQAGDPVKGAEVMYDVFTSSGVAEGKPVPKYLPLGSDAVEEISKAAQQTIDETQAWAKIASMSDFPSA